ncbi:hypothetical protein P3X46_007222, partial [Hevea brasiliensis]
MGQEYDMDKKKAKRYTQRLHSKYSSLILVAETHSFHSIVDAVRKMEARAIIEVQKSNNPQFLRLPIQGG